MNTRSVQETENKTIHELTAIQTLLKSFEFPIWDTLNAATKKATLEQLGNLIAESVVAGVSFIGTRSQYEVAKLIPVGQEGHIPAKSLVIITDENDYVIADERGD